MRTKQECHLERTICLAWNFLNYAFFPIERECSGSFSLLCRALNCGKCVVLMSLWLVCCRQPSSISLLVFLYNFFHFFRSFFLLLWHRKAFSPEHKNSSANHLNHCQRNTMNDFREGEEFCRCFISFPFFYIVCIQYFYFIFISYIFSSLILNCTFWITN